MTQPERVWLAVGKYTGSNLSQVPYTLNNGSLHSHQSFHKDIKNAISSSRILLYSCSHPVTFNLTNWYNVAKYNYRYNCNDYEFRGSEFTENCAKKDLMNCQGSAESTSRETETSE
jgi:hypothetical protein